MATNPRANVIRRSPSGPIIGQGGGGAGAIERLGALQAVAPATATGIDFVPVPSGASPPFAPTLEVAFADVDAGKSVLVLGVVTFLEASTLAIPEIRAEISTDDGVTYAPIEESNAADSGLVGHGNIALACVSAPLAARAEVLRVRLAWRASTMTPTDTFEIDPSQGANAQIIAAIVPGTERP